MDLTVRPIGTVRSPYRERFGVPRQPGLTHARAFIDLDPEQIPPAALRGLEEATHLWVIFVFDRVAQTDVKATVRPPRLGGNARVGVLATRSPYRPNRLGISAVRLVHVEGSTLEIEGADLLDGTPVLDIKPYVPYADAIPAARLAWANEPPPRLAVRFDNGPAQAVAQRPELRRLIEETVALDPRPAYHGEAPNRVYGTILQDVDVRFVIEDGTVVVRAIVPIASTKKGQSPAR